MERLAYQITTDMDSWDTSDENTAYRAASLMAEEIAELFGVECKLVSGPEFNTDCRWDDDLLESIQRHQNSRWTEILLLAME